MVTSLTGSGLMMVMNSNQFGSVLPSAKNHERAEPGGGNWACETRATDRGASAAVTARVATKARPLSVFMRSLPLWELAPHGAVGEVVGVDIDVEGRGIGDELRHLRAADERALTAPVGLAAPW